MKASQMLRDGVEMTVTDVETGYVPHCPDECERVAGCSMRRLSMRANGAPLTRVTVVVRNGSGKWFSMDADAWEMVDAQGFAMGGAAVCEMLLPASYVQVDRWNVSPGTRVRTALVFPAPPSGGQIAALLYASGDRMLRFEISSLETNDARGNFRTHPEPPKDARASEAGTRSPLPLLDGTKVKRLYGERVHWKRGKKKRKIRIEECYSVKSPGGEQMFLAIGRKKKKKRSTKESRIKEKHF